MTIISTRRPFTSHDVELVLEHAMREAARPDWSLLRSARRIAFDAHHETELLQLARAELAMGRAVTYEAKVRRALATLTVAIGMTKEGGGHAHGGVSAPPP
jgi:hypothetical protein